MSPKPNCFCCKSPLIIYRNNIDNDVLYFDNHLYHKDCFIQWCHATKKPTPKRTMALNNLDRYLNEGENIVSNLLEKKRIDKNNKSKRSK